MALVTISTKKWGPGLRVIFDRAGPPISKWPIPHHMLAISIHRGKSTSTFATCPISSGVIFTTNTATPVYKVSKKDHRYIHTYLSPLEQVRNCLHATSSNFDHYKLSLVGN